MAAEHTAHAFQFIAYLKRYPSLTREQFYTHWESKHAPLVTPFFQKNGVIRYQQIHASGFIVPNRDGYAAKEPIEFDGIALTLVPSLECMMGRENDAYFKDVVEKDEVRFLDREAPGKGIVALFVGKAVGFMEGGVSVQEGREKA